MGAQASSDASATVGSGITGRELDSIARQLRGAFLGVWRAARGNRTRANPLRFGVGARDTSNPKPTPVENVRDAFYLF